MTVPSHFKFTFRGHFEDSPEFWSFGCFFSRNVTGGQDAELDNISESGVTAAIATFMANAMMATVTRLDDWRAYVIGTNGKMQGNAPLLHLVDPGSPIAGAGGLSHPYQVAVVATRVAANRGPAHLGRMYLPCLAAPLSTGGRMTAATALSLAQATSAFLKDISDAIDLPLDQGSSAGLNISKQPVVTGTKQEVDHIRVGRAFDTMQSRRTNLDEDYQEDTHIDW
jgi:hypothetical protein